MGPSSLLQRKCIAYHPSYIQTLVHEHYVPTLRLVRARIELNYSRDDLRRYNQDTSRQCHPANGIDAPTHVAHLSPYPGGYKNGRPMVLATGCGILSCQLGDRESYSAIYDSNEYEAVYNGGVTAVPDAKGEGGSDGYPRLANVEGCRDGSEWFQCLCWRLHRKDFAKCFRM